MQKYTEIVLGQNGQTLLPLAGASVTVLTYPGGAAATIYSDNGITLAANPLTTDLNGRYSFYAANGRYSLRVTYLNVTYPIIDFPLQDDPANAQTYVITGGSIDGTPIGSTTPSSILATTIAASGAITPSQTAGIVGTTTNNNANAGSVGEFITNTASGVALSNSVQANVVSISLSAGDWNVFGGSSITSSAATLLNSAAGFTTTSATLGGATTQIALQFSSYQGFGGSPPMMRISVAAPTTVYLVAVAFFGSGTVTAAGTISARRVR